MLINQEGRFTKPLQCLPYLHDNYTHIYIFFFLNGFKSSTTVISQISANSVFSKECS